MNYIAITVDVESDSAAFADPERNTFQGVIDGLPRLTNFFLDQGYPVTLFVSCDVLHELDVEFIVRPDIEIASHGYKHTYPPYYLKTLPLQELRRNLEESKFTLSKTFKTNVVGFRAHGLMVTSSIINEISEYYLYDSSVIMHRKYDGNTLKSSRSYHPARNCVVKNGDLPIVEIPVSCIDLRLLKLPFIGSWIAWFPTAFFRNLGESLIVMNLHCQDPVRFGHWKSLFSGKYLAKLKGIIDYYEMRGYEILLMREIAERFKKALF